MPRNWDEHYSDSAHLDFTPDPLLVEAADLLLSGWALDLASGTGRHALHLARLGWHATAVDASAVAVELLRTRGAGLPIQVIQADLERDASVLKPDRYDLVCDFFYLQRSLFPLIRESVRPGGVFVGAIHLFDDAPATRPRNPDFLMQPGELRGIFQDWKVLFYSEAGETGRSRRTARLIARRA